MSTSAALFASIVLAASRGAENDAPACNAASEAGEPVVRVYGVGRVDASAIPGASISGRRERVLSLSPLFARRDARSVRAAALAAAILRAHGLTAHAGAVA